MAAEDNKQAAGSYPEGDAFNRFVRRRQRTGRVWHGLFLGAVLLGLLALAALVVTVVDDAFGYVAIENSIDEDVLIANHLRQQTAAPNTLSSGSDQALAEGGVSDTPDATEASDFGATLEEQSPAILIELLAANVSTGRLRALEAKQPIAERSRQELIELIRAEVIEPQVVESWSLFESLFDKAAIEAQAAAMPGADLQFRSWVNWNFITSPQSTDPLNSGIKVAILGSIWVTVIGFLVAVPLGVAAAVYLEEYSSGKSRFDQIIEVNINNLAGVPSIIYGMLGLAVFVRFLEPLTSGAFLDQSSSTTANGRTILSAGLTLAVLILPLVIINAREAVRAVPRALREASFGLGATRWQTVWNHVLPNALSGILTGVILSVSRAFGETAPLIVVGVSTFIVVSPNSPFSKYTTLPAQIYQWTSRPQQEFQHLAAAGILVLLALLIALNATAIFLRNRYSQRKY